MQLQTCDHAAWRCLEVLDLWSRSQGSPLYAAPSEQLVAHMKVDWQVQNDATNTQKLSSEDKF